MDPQAFAIAMPKVDVHCHLLGSIDLDTAVELAASNDTRFSRQIIEAAYLLEDLPRGDREMAFFEGLDMVAELVRTPGDISRAVYGLVSHGVRTSNLRYLELMVNPSAFARTGITFAGMQEGLVDGARQAEVDFGVRTNFIAGIMRDEPVAMAREIVDNLSASRIDQFVGIGLDGPEYLDHHRPAHFADVFRDAGRLGLKRTAHYCYFGPEVYDDYAELLGCDRLDHGYPVIDDEDVLRRAAESGIPFTVCPSITRLMANDSQPEYFEGSTHPIGTMYRAGIWTVPGTDDEAMAHTDLGTEYALLADWYDWNVESLAEAALVSISATWLDESDQRALRTQFERDLKQLSNPS